MVCPKESKRVKRKYAKLYGEFTKNPQKVANFFLHPSVKYASW